MTSPMPETMSPREKVPYGLIEVINEVRRRYPAAFDGTDPIAVHPPSLENATDLFLACCLAALASSGDHAELARLAEAATPGNNLPQQSPDVGRYRVRSTTTQQGGRT